MRISSSITQRIPRLVRPACLAFLLVFAGCAHLADTRDSAYSDSYGREVFGAGYVLISDRYIDSIAMHDLAISGISGLTSVDAQLQVSEANGSARIAYANEPVGTVVLPTSENPDAWTDATVRAVALARAASPAVGDADAEAIFKAVFDGVVQPLDSFSRYATAETAKEHRAMRDGFGGIGVSIRMDGDTALVLAVNVGGPAAAADVMPDDRLTHVEGESIAGWTQRKLVDHLRGPVGSRVNFTLRRSGHSDPIEISMVRQHIVPVTVTSSREGDIAIIRVGGFNRETAEDVADAVEAERGRNGRPLAGIILDLRSNPGGLLDQAIELVDAFLDSGDIVSTRGRHPRSLQRFVASVGDTARGLPMVVLVNGLSASASEVVTAALQDHARAIVIGTNSFGKGTVQTVLELPNDGEITLTWSRLVTPSGYQLDDLGVLPTICTRAGGSEAIPPEHLLTHVRNGENLLTDQFSRWRATGYSKAADRETLRGICPSDSTSPDTDIAIAKSLLSDPRLYERVLSLGSVALAHREGGR